MAAEALPFQAELRQADYLELLKQAKRQSRVSARLIAATEPERKRGIYLFTGYVTDGLALRGVALVPRPGGPARNRPGVETGPRGVAASVPQAPLRSHR